ncbi:hypothetical protein EV193_111135 [Herbihabitans rhizosphaerae]|uniref:Uncharacterized protein n=1 Tax=Herbihabitans rhizosphaerae TaxID=1872711 RepID=A0A4Q7KFL0_9PSEU|nr:hypothetical protein [Herbihabitans rhizosphaerae]RZS32750.1 hypothetical protein EV193_111135 [Herbihabitans rhizosphaerae]
MTDRRGRLDFLLRRHHGKARRDRLRTVLDTLPAGSWTFLDLAESDARWPAMRQAYGAAREADTLDVGQELPAAAFEPMLREALTRLGDSVLVATSDVRTAGVLEIAAAPLIEHSLALLDLDRDDLFACRRDLTRGVAAQRFEYSDGVRYLLESWGD